MKYAYHKNSTATAESRRKTSRTRAGRNILFPLAALLLCATACQKEGGRGTLTATIEPYESNAKTYIDADHYACWEDGDEVRINGTAYGISTGGQPGRASINTGGTSPEGDLTAFYPADMISSDMTTVTLPPVQKYEVRNGRQVIQSPMAAYCAADGTNLPFHNLGALLQVTLPATTGSTVLSISVKGNRGQQMCGTAELRIKEGQPQLSTFRVGCDSVILSDINQELTTARSYYIVVPAYTSFAEMTIHVVLKQSDGSVSVHHKSDDTFGKTLDRNHIGAFGYNLDGIVSTYPATRVLLYTTTDNTHVTPAGLPNIDYQTYGMIALNADMTEIGADAFRNLTNLASVTLPKGVTTISFHAFQECTSLTSVTLPENLRTISNSVFQGCTSLQTITLPEGVIGIGNSVFYGCTSLQSVTLPESLETMANYVFQGCTSLQTITLPSTLTALGQSVFEGSGLTSITIPSRVTQINSSTFKDCTSLTSVTLPEGLTTISNYVFQGCTSLQSITLPSTLTALGQSVFEGSGLTSITIPSSVTEIKSSTFKDCTSLTSVALPEGLTTIWGSAFQGCTSLTSVALPDGLTAIWGSAFQGCTSLTTVALPPSVTLSDWSVFEGSGLTTITIPEGMTQIPGKTFKDCAHLTEVTLLRYTDGQLITAGGYKMFENCTALAHIYVPAGSETTYKAANYWSDFSNIISELPASDSQK